MIITVFGPLQMPKEHQMKGTQRVGSIFKLEDFSIGK